MAFLLDKLAALAPKETVSTGIRLAADGSVLIRRHAPGLVISYVRDGASQHTVVIEYGEGLSDIEAASCNCYQFTEDGNAALCRHIVATALKAGRYPPADSIEEAKKLKTSLEKNGGFPLRRMQELLEKKDAVYDEDDIYLQSVMARLKSLHEDSIPGTGQVIPINRGRDGFFTAAQIHAPEQPRAGEPGPLVPAPQKSTDPIRLVPPPPVERRTDYWGSQLLRETTARASRMADAGFTDEPFQLEALLGLDYKGAATLSFRVGAENGGHMYIIRNLKDFVDGFKAGESYALGTKRQIVLTRDTFSSACMPVLDFLLERYDSMSNGFPGRARDRRDMVLNPGEADAFFALAKELYLKTGSPNERQEATIRDKDCRLRIRIEKAGEATDNGLILRAMDPYRAIEGVRRVYILSDFDLYKCSEEYSFACKDLLIALTSRKDGMYFSGRDAPALFANIIRKTEPYLEFEMDGGVGALAPPELETKVYFDMDENGYVTARMSFSYGDITHDAFEEPRRPEASLDPAGEVFAERALRHYFGNATSGPGTLILLDNAAREERLYSLATEGLDKIREFAEVFVSESFDNFRARPPMNIAVGVKVEGRLLTLNINAEGLDFSELADILKSYRLAKKYHRLKDGSFLALEGEALGELSDLAEGLDLDPARFVKDTDDPNQSSIDLDLSRALYIDSMMRKNESIRYDRDKNFRGLLRNFSDVANADYQPPDTLTGILRNYQETGYRWLRTMDALGFGGILADDMGLGKTLQILTLLSAVKTEDQAKDWQPSIVICPASLVLNWESEAARFTPELSVCVVIGSADVRKTIIRTARKVRPAKIKAGQSTDTKNAGQMTDANNAGQTTDANNAGQSTDTKNAGQTTDANNAGQMTDANNAGQTTDANKPGQTTDANNAGQMTDAKKAGEMTDANKAGHAPDLFVTSYDLLKRDIEAYEGIDFRFVVIDEAQYIKNQTTQNARAVKLLTGRTRFALTGTPIENTLAELWSIFDFLMPGYLFRYRHFQRVFETPIVKRTDIKAENRLKEMVRPFILRRLKKDVLKELPEKIETVLKSEMGDEQHKLYLANVARTKKELSERLAAAGGPKAKFEILAALMRMRRICCDPALIYENYTGGSTKLDACMELVESCIASGHRILLFSQFTTMLDRIEARLWDAKIDWYRLDGSTKAAERHSMMNRFNSGDVPVFLISLRAGGTGLNLAGADIVIHYDPWWNISVQNQATDRAHRIGQTKSVQVFKLITKDTIEERIMEMQERKADLADRIIREGGDAFESLTEEELMKLFE